MTKARGNFRGNQGYFDSALPGTIPLAIPCIHGSYKGTSAHSSAQSGSLLASGRFRNYRFFGAHLIDIRAKDKQHARVHCSSGSFTTFTFRGLPALNVW